MISERVFIILVKLQKTTDKKTTIAYSESTVGTDLTLKISKKYSSPNPILLM
jgi:hypothetical protein